MSIVSSVSLSFFSAVTVPAILSLLWNRIRRHHYETFEERKDPRLTDASEGLRSLASASTLAKSRFPSSLRAFHNSANALQSRYHFFLSMAVSSLMVGFLGLTAAVTIAHASAAFGLFAALLDTFCFLIVAGSIFACVRTNRRWIRARIVTELCRQCHAMSTLDSGANGSDWDADGGIRRKIEDAVVTMTDPVATIRALWYEQIQRFSTLDAQGPIASDASAGYLLRRVVRQADWFQASQLRIAHQIGRKEAALEACFGAVLVLSVVKLLAFLKLDGGVLYEWKYLQYFLIFLFLGFSTWLTALFVGQNSKSMMYRYRDQNRKIHDWLRLHAFDPDRQTAANTLANIKLSARAVLHFEEIMTDELIYWVEVTERDVIELSPS